MKMNYERNIFCMERQPDIKILKRLLAETNRIFQIMKPAKNLSYFPFNINFNGKCYGFVNTRWTQQSITS